MYISQGLDNLWFKGIFLTSNFSVFSGGKAVPGFWKNRQTERITCKITTRILSHTVVLSRQCLINPLRLNFRVLLCSYLRERKIIFKINFKDTFLRPVFINILEIKSFKSALCTFCGKHMNISGQTHYMGHTGIVKGEHTLGFLAPKNCIKLFLKTRRLMLSKAFLYLKV